MSLLYSNIHFLVCNSKIVLAFPVDMSLFAVENAGCFPEGTLLFDIKNFIDFLKNIFLSWF